MSSPERPTEVPESARWDGSRQRWLQGAMDANGYRSGEWRGWNVNGVLIEVETWTPDGRNGRFQYWFGDGAPMSEGVHDSRHEFGEGEHRRWREPQLPLAWKPFDERVDGKVIRAEAWFTIMGGFVDKKYFDADGNRVTPRGRLLDEAVAKEKRKSKLSAQEKLAALAGVSLPDEKKK